MRFNLVLKEIFQSIARNMSMVVSVILVTFVSITFVGVAGLMQLQIDKTKSFWYGQSEVAIYLCTEFDNSEFCSDGIDSQTVVNDIETILDSEVLDPYVDSYYFEDEETVYNNFQKKFEGNPIVDSVQSGDLSETFWVKLEDSSDSSILVESFSTVQGVQSVVDQKSLLQPILNQLATASAVAVTAATLMSVAAVLLISTTIRLSAMSRRKEIEIMRLVGASNRFVQIPFILEGVLAAGIGAVGACAATLGIVKFFVENRLGNSGSSFSFITLNESWILVPFLLILGILLAASVAKIAIVRYLKV